MNVDKIAHEPFNRKVISITKICKFDHQKTPFCFSAWGLAKIIKTYTILIVWLTCLTRMNLQGRRGAFRSDKDANLMAIKIPNVA